jgi:hypothetical protein
MSNIDRFFGQVAPIKEICAIWDRRSAKPVAAE